MPKRFKKHYYKLITDQVLASLWCLLCLLGATSAQALDRYDRSECKAPALLVENTLAQVDERYLPKHLRLQQLHQTCYGFTSQFLLQFLMNRSEETPPESPLIPSVVDLIIRHKRSNLTTPDRGHTALLLQKFRHTNQNVCLDSLDQDGNGDYERFFGANLGLLSMALAKDNHQGEFMSWLSKLNPDWTKRVQDNLQGVATPLLKDIYSAPAQAFYLTSCAKTSKVPDFNIFQVHLKKQKAELDQASFEREFQDHVIFLLKKGYPLAIGVGPHTVSMSGVRKVCCGDSCHFEWQITNSLPSDLEEDSEINQWYLAKNFSQTYDATQIRPCSGDECRSNIQQVDLRQDPLKPGAKGGRALELALQSDDTVELKEVIRSKKRPLTEEEKLKYFLTATNYGGIEIPKWLVLDQKLSVDSILSNGSPLLHHAARNHVLDLVTFLLKSKADTKKFDRQGRAAFFAILESDQPEMVSRFLKSRGSKEVRDANGDSPLFYCIREKRTKMLRHLLQLKFNPNELSLNGVSALQFAQDLGNKAAASLLIEMGAQ